MYCVTQSAPALSVYIHSAEPVSGEPHVYRILKRFQFSTEAKNSGGDGTQFTLLSEKGIFVGKYILCT